MTEIVSSFDTARDHHFAEAFLASAVAFWPRPWRLTCYVSDPAPLTVRWPRFTFLPLPESVRVFQDGCGDRERGRTPQPCWRGKDLHAGYSFRTDAARFCHKPFALIDHAARRSKNEETAFFWLDSDVVTKRPLPRPLFEDLLPPDAAVARLHRPNSYSETGWLGLRMPGARSFLKRLAVLYLTGELYELSQWHDSWVIDYALKMTKTPVYDVSNTRHHDIWANSRLDHWLCHLKGDRKHDPQYRDELRHRVLQKTGVDLPL